MEDLKLNSIRDDPYGTHRPCLIELVKNTTGNIIELGCGNSSTLLIRELIKNTDRKLISLESNLEWLNKFKHLENNNHNFFYIDAGNDNNDETGKKWIDFIKNNEVLNKMKFDICFIDQSPWIARTFSLKYFKDKCPYIIVHDVDYFPNNNMWGKNIQKKIIRRQGRKLEIYDMDFSDIAKNYKVYYPPLEFFAGSSGPPTLVCSDIVSPTDFDKICNNINYDKYYN